MRFSLLLLSLPAALLVLAAVAFAAGNFSTAGTAEPAAACCCGSDCDCPNCQCGPACCTSGGDCHDCDCSAATGCQQCGPAKAHHIPAERCAASHCCP